MTKAFNSIRIVDSTHVLAGPFASYQLGILGAEVIKVESPHSPDQARMQGADRAMNDRGMGTSFMAQASGKKVIALDLKSEGGRLALLRLLKTADVFVQNFRPGSFDRLGLSYEVVRKVNPRLIYCSISAFGATGPRCEETGYDNVIQASSGMMAMTGHGDGRPLKSGAQLVDYGTGFAAAFAISAALFQREKTGVGQYIDVSMFDVALMLCSSHVAGLTWTGSVPKAKGNRFPFATIGCYRASDTDIMIAASNLSQQRRLWIALGREDMVKTDNNQRLDAHEMEEAVLGSIIATRSTAEWETLLRKHRIPASRIRTLAEAVADPQTISRAVVQDTGMSGPREQKLKVAVSGFKMSASPAEVTCPPQPVGSQTDEILTSLGYGKEEIVALRAQGSVG